VNVAAVHETLVFTHLVLKKPVPSAMRVMPVEQ